MVDRRQTATRVVGGGVMWRNPRDTVTWFVAPCIASMFGLPLITAHPTMAALTGIAALGLCCPDTHRDLLPDDFHPR